MKNVCGRLREFPVTRMLAFAINIDSIAYMYRETIFAAVLSSISNLCSSSCASAIFFLSSSEISRSAPRDICASSSAPCRRLISACRFSESTLDSSRSFCSPARADISPSREVWTAFTFSLVPFLAKLLFDLPSRDLTSSAYSSTTRSDSWRFSSLISRKKYVCKGVERKIGHTLLSSSAILTRLSHSLSFARSSSSSSLSRTEFA